MEMECQNLDLQSLIQYCINLNSNMIAHSIIIQNLQRRRSRLRRRVQHLNQMITSFSFHPRIDRPWKLMRQQSWWDDIVPNMSEEEWKANFRLSKGSFHFICTSVEPLLKRKNTKMRECIPIDKRVAVALYFLSSSAEYRTISNLFGIGKSTVCIVVLEFCHSVVNSMMQQFISLPLTKETAKKIIDGFWKDWGFPQCIGAIDGCHIPVSPTKEHAVDYYNYKGWYSMVLLALVDHRYRFLYLNVGSPGRNNDGHIFRKSSLSNFLNHQSLKELQKKIRESIVLPLIIGDSAFPLQPNLMKPYPDNKGLQDVQRNFNFRLSGKKGCRKCFWIA